MARSLALGIALAFASVCVALGAEQAGGDPGATLERLISTPLPARDPLDLAVRLRGVRPEALAAQRPRAAPPELGQQDEFWILDQRTARMFQVRATVRLATDRTLWYVQDDLSGRVAQTALERSASVFETGTYPVVRRYFGTEPALGVDGDPRIVFLLGDVPGVAAYFSGADAYPRAANPRSNERDMIYVNLNALRPGLALFDATLAHEFQHMVHFAHCPVQETWVDEGAAELASHLAGYRGGTAQAFSARPDVQLTAWSTEPSELSRHYEASYLFWSYLVDRGGGPAILPDVLGPCAKGERLFQGFLQRHGWEETLDELFADWTVANLLNDRTVEDGRYGYTDASVRASITAVVPRTGRLEGTVPQYAAQYLELPAGAGTVTFEGSESVPVLSADPAEGGYWWSNRADSLDSRLTRTVDLRGVETATARFRAWFNLEDRYDYVYLVVSDDGGATWRVLPGRSTVSDETIGNGYGAGWTGDSGGETQPQWVDEEVDLSAFAGSEILVRFEYLTDQGYSAQGFALRDFRVPEIGMVDGPGPSAGWQADGWLWIDAPLPERWQVRLVRWTSEGVYVDPVDVPERGQTLFETGGATNRAVLVVAPTAPRTLQPGRYAVTTADARAPSAFGTVAAAIGSALLESR